MAFIKRSELYRNDYGDNATIYWEIFEGDKVLGEAQISFKSIKNFKLNEINSINVVSKDQPRLEAPNSPKKAFTDKGYESFNNDLNLSRNSNVDEKNTVEKIIDLLNFSKPEIKDELNISKPDVQKESSNSKTDLINPATTVLPNELEIDKVAEPQEQALVEPHVKSEGKLKLIQRELNPTHLYEEITHGFKFKLSLTFDLCEQFANVELNNAYNKYSKV